jgi:hypothetical protein
MCLFSVTLPGGKSYDRRHVSRLRIGNGKDGERPRDTFRLARRMEAAFPQLGRKAQELRAMHKDWGKLFLFWKRPGFAQAVFIG